MNIYEIQFEFEEKLKYITADNLSVAILLSPPDTLVWELPKLSEQEYDEINDYYCNHFSKIDSDRIINYGYRFSYQDFVIGIKEVSSND